MQDAFDDQIDGIAALQHPLSRRIYRVALAQDWVSRDSVSDMFDVARSVAAFHLDKLVAAGLLVTRFERLSGRSGPGAGRPAKLYGRSATEVDLSLPPRRYHLAGAVLADAVSKAGTGGVSINDALADAARAAGSQIGRDRPVRSRARQATDLLAILAAHGYEPRSKGRSIVLSNCPFHSLADQHRDVVCAMNLNLLTGVIDGAGKAQAFTARLAPEPGFCCVRVDRR